jgi:hypothetical protein
MTDIIKVPANTRMRLKAVRDEEHDKFDVVDMAFQFNGETMLPEPWAYWKMEEPSGNRIDATGHGHHLVPQHPGYDPGYGAGLVSGNSLVFPNPGLSDLYEVSTELYSPIADNVPFTLSFWFKSTGASESYIRLLNATFGTAWLILTKNAANLEMDLENNTDEDIFIATLASFDLTQKHFVCIRGDGSNVYLEIDNSPIGSITGGSWGDSGTFLVYLQGIYYGNANTYVDEAGFWLQELTADQRTYLYNSGAGRTLYP